ncbi:MAG: Dot/Icm type IV secretion system effector CoxH3 [Gemmatimonadota bacterium]|nr:MAG: Dot/Icm type IV secretion system effector CoxH3 [Gemmatimonadota bacterium]
MKIPVSHGHLEASMREPPSDPVGAAVVCHPHPLYGGSMHTKAVYRAAQALADSGLRALRFNFRGVGASTGSHEEGIGEREDVRAALDWLSADAPGMPMVAGGFSFGSMVALGEAVADDRVVALLGMGLPIDMYDYSYLSGADKPVLVVQGEDDEFGSGDKAAEVVRALGDHVTLARIAGADHYFNDRFDDLREVIVEYFTTGAGAEALKVARGGRRS